MKNLLLFIAISLTVSFSDLNAQQFDQGELFSIRSTFGDMSTVDFDGDGDLDILGSTAQFGIVYWWVNDGSGNFLSQKVIATDITTPLRTNAADLDGDGDMDVLTCSPSDDKIIWYQNDGNGNFSSELYISSLAVGVGYIYAADVDSDGDADVLAAYQSMIFWFENNGSGSFGPPQPIMANNISSRSLLRSSDIDGDGDLDLIYLKYFPIPVSFSERIIWRENDGLGNFGDEQIISELDIDDVCCQLFIYDYSFADVDGDDDLDVIHIHGYDIKDANGISFNTLLGMQKNDGTGNFGPIQYLDGEPGTNNPGLHVSDLDGDGDADIVYGSSGSQRLKYYNSSEGVFDASIVLPSYNGNCKASGDLDGDEDLDLVTHTGSWIENQGSGEFEEHMNFIFTGVSSRFSIADIDGDNDEDVVIGDSNVLSWIENDGNGNEISFNFISNQFDHIRSVITEDIDGDGDKDVLASADSTRLVWFENDGEGNFGPQIVISDDTGCNTANSYCSSDISASDLDGDGDLDILTGSLISVGPLAWYENDGNANFGQLIIIEDDVNQNSLLTTDLDQDGDKDVLKFETFNGLTWHENDGSGSFAEPTSISDEFITAYRGVAIDMDNDGDNDIVAILAENTQQFSGWYENDGSGNFPSFHYITPPGESSIYNIDVFDTNMDGHLDIVLVKDSIGCNNFVQYYRNDGMMNFSLEEAIEFDDCHIPVNLHSADFDGDADEDVLVSIWSSGVNGGRMVLFKNLSPDACIAGNFISSPSGLFIDQTLAGGTMTRLYWSHYSDASDACLIKAGIVAEPDIDEPFISPPGQVLIQGNMDTGIGGYDFTSAFLPDEEVNLFNISTYPNGNIVELVPGAHYKWQVKCGCMIDPMLPLPDRFLGSNLHLSPWSDYSVFTNLSLSNSELDIDNDQKSLEGNDLVVFPNPTNSEVKISGFEGFLSIYNSLGAKVIDLKINNEASRIINTESWGAGLYLMKFRKPDSTEVITKLLYIN